MKNIGYMAILLLHAYFYALFLYDIAESFLIFIICFVSSLILISLAFYTFLSNKSYYYYFFIGIIVSSIPIALAIYPSSFLIIPEFIFLIILFYNGVETGSTYYKMRVNKQSNLMQHDPAVVNYYAQTTRSLAFKMDEVWNPDSTLPFADNLQITEKANVWMEITSLFFSVAFLIPSFISVVFL